MWSQALYVIISGNELALLQQKLINRIRHFVVIIVFNIPSVAVVVM